ncbi:MAG: hypothetical protein ACRER2_10520 [Methylococcales bacterium]
MWPARVLATFVSLFVLLILCLAVARPLAADEPQSTKELVWRLRLFQEWLSGHTHERTHDYEVIHCVASGDATGTQVAFVVLTQEYRWKIGDMRNILVARKTVPVETVLDRLLLERQFLTRQKVVAVGMASVEGSVVKETVRAQRRANNLLAWLETKLDGSSSPPELYTLNLGKYSRPKTKRPKDTSSQRRVMLIGVNHAQSGFEMKTALRDCWNRAKPQPAVELTDYSAFDLRTASLLDPSQ